jgi:hypothetical protein
MTRAQKVVIAVAVAGALTTGVYEGREVIGLRRQVQELRPEQTRLPALRAQVQALQQELSAATNAVAALAAQNAALKQTPSEVLRLRGLLGRLNWEKAQIASTSALSKLTSNPELKKWLRNQLKTSFRDDYKAFAKSAKLSDEQTEKLTDLLSDEFMDNVAGQITTVLQNKPPLDEIKRIFAAQDASLQARVQELIGPEALAQYQEYNRNLGGQDFAREFKGQMTGSDEERTAKAKQLAQVFSETAQAVLAGAGLPVDELMPPAVSFRCLASEQESERVAKLGEDILHRAAANCGSFLTAEERAKLPQFGNKYIKDAKENMTSIRAYLAPMAE